MILQTLLPVNAPLLTFVGSKGMIHLLPFCLELMDLAGVFANTAAVLIGGIAGLLFAGRIGEKYTKALVTGLALLTSVIGIMSAIETQDILCVIICIVLGTIIGEALRIDDRIESLGERVKAKLTRGKGGAARFTEGFVTASILFCIGSMAVMGSIEAGIRGDNGILFTKSIIDVTASAAYGAAMGVGVAASAVCILIFEGGLTLLAGSLAPVLTDTAVTEMSAVGGVLLIGMAVNLLGLRPERIKIANLLPAIFLPIVYLPVYNWLTGLIK
ncbi:MAG TPA: DUF554 domain-containing protein [Clostridiales bacterium]|nr:DUF554 domain-containing protein [Clostridiales bacterium]